MEETPRRSPSSSAKFKQKMTAIEDMHRDRMIFLDLTSDPISSATERDFANNVLRNDFSQGVQDKGGSSIRNKVFAAYQLQFFKATKFASAKATVNYHLSTSTGSALGSGSSGNNIGKITKPGSDSQNKKEATAKKKAASEKSAGTRAGGHGEGVAMPKEENK